MKILKKLLCSLMCLMLFASGALAQEEDSNRVQALMDGIFACHLAQSGAENLQALLDSELAPKAGSGSEWMLFALGQTGDYDFSAACATLLDTISRTNVISAVTQQKYALVLKTMGSDDAFIQKAAQETVGAQGIMSWVYGLHLLNNGCAGSMTAEQAVQQLLALQLADGGWALRGEVSDVDVTAMTMQALAPHMQQAEVAQSLERAVALLSARQLDSGDYVSYGKPNPESAAQVVIALSAMGIDAFKDERFIKNGSTLLDVISHYRLEDGSFCHVEGGDSNANATVQVLHSMIAWQRMHAGEGSLYRIAPKQLVKPTAKLGYKTVAMIVIAAAAALSCLVLFVLGKRSLKNYLAVLALAAALAAFFACTDFQSADSYYSGQPVEKENVVGTVTLCILCDKAVGQTALELPADGVMLAPASFAIKQGDTVFGILTEAARAYGVRLDSSGTQGMKYVSGINQLYEYACGDLSGWVYRVNGESPNVGCDQYVLADGDNIEWRYTCELGNDL